MLRAVRKLAGLVLACLLAVTAGLYLPVTVQAATQVLRQRAQQAQQQQEPVPAPVPLAQQPIGEESGLPPFFAPELLAQVVQREAFVVLAEGSEANLWLVARRPAGWEVLGGPYYCRIGADGLSGGQPAASATPAGVTSAGLLYVSGADRSFSCPVKRVETPTVFVNDKNSKLYNRCLPAALAEGAHGRTFLPDGAVLALDIGCNPAADPAQPAAIVLQAGDTRQPTDGCIVAAEGDLLRLLLQLKGQPGVVIASAQRAGWSVEAGMPDSFVLLREATSGIREQPRYSGSDNFMGRPLDGYLGHSVVVTREMAAALQQAQEALARQNLSLLVFDGYRPKRAVRDIFAWLADAESPGNKQAYYPALPKSALGGVYLAEQSPHTRGAAVDLTICDASGQALDMGTGFDVFSPASWHGAAGLTAEQTANRNLLRQTMRAAGLTHYDKEWWHYNLPDRRSEERDFVIPQ